MFFSRFLLCAATPVLVCVCASVFAMGHDLQREPVVWGKEYAGQVHVPDPSNWMVGSRLTGEDCTISLRPGQGRDILVRTSFWEGEKLARADGLPGEDFYLGKFSDQLAFVLQTMPAKRPWYVSLTGYDAQGSLMYGPRYQPADTAEIPGARECRIPF